MSGAAALSSARNRRSNPSGPVAPFAKKNIPGQQQVTSCSTVRQTQPTKQQIQQIQQMQLQQQQMQQRQQQGQGQQQQQGQGQQQQQGQGQQQQQGQQLGQLQMPPPALNLIQILRLHDIRLNAIEQKVEQQALAQPQQQTQQAQQPPQQTQQAQQTQQQTLQIQDQQTQINKLEEAVKSLKDELYRLQSFYLDLNMRLTTALLPDDDTTIYTMNMGSSSMNLNMGSLMNMGNINNASLQIVSDDNDGEDDNLMSSFITEIQDLPGL